MSRDQQHDSTPLEDPAQLRQYFEESFTARHERGIGTEHEKFGFHRDTGHPLAYEGEHGIGALFDRLVEHEGWTPIRDGQHVLALERDGAAVTLEPGGQLELSGAVTRTIHETAAELHQHLDEVARHAEPLGQQWCLLGMNPWDDLDDVPWMPKSRYSIMRRYLPTVGRLAHWMMKMTCTVQANYDFTDEADAMDILRTGLRLSPLVSALFANSPVQQGRATGLVSNRMAIWEETDPARCGVPPFMLREDSSFDDYVEYLLDVPMFFIRRNDAYLDLAGESFRAFMKDGLRGHTATLGDFELHLSTAFPEVRMKRYIEVRSADCGPAPFILALPALWKGILYDDEARRQAAALVPMKSADELRALFGICRTEGLSGHFRGRPIRHLALELVRIAGDGLDRQAEGHPSERSFLDPLLGDDGMPRNPGDMFLSAWRAHEGDREAIQTHFSIR
ncbi:MAG: glutamate--cysteine ligase [Deltaproteobacteria bacterium]|nr:MAG: glutamate--cysteine ligase [Deltaproteobacteria bacterium]